MTTPPIPTSGLWPSPGCSSAGEITAFSETVRHTVAMAAQLAVSGRRVDITGLDQTVGALCAKALDLPPFECRAARVGLIALLAELDALSSALRSKSPE